MNMPRVLYVLSLLLAAETDLAQVDKNRTIEQYECKDVICDSGANRDVAIAFLHGFLLGRSGGSSFDLAALHKQSDAFIERCLDNPKEKAVDAMSAVKQ